MQTDSSVNKKKQKVSLNSDLLDSELDNVLDGIRASNTNSKKTDDLVKKDKPSVNFMKPFLGKRIRYLSLLVMAIATFASILALNNAQNIDNRTSAGLATDSSVVIQNAASDTLKCETENVCNFYFVTKGISEVKLLNSPSFVSYAFDKATQNGRIIVDRSNLTDDQKNSYFAVNILFLGQDLITTKYLELDLIVVDQSLAIPEGNVSSRVVQNPLSADCSETINIVAKSKWKVYPSLQQCSESRVFLNPPDVSKSIVSKSVLNCNENLATQAESDYVFQVSKLEPVFLILDYTNANFLQKSSTTDSLIQFLSSGNYYSQEFVMSSRTQNFQAIDLDYSILSPFRPANTFSSTLRLIGEQDLTGLGTSPVEISNMNLRYLGETAFAFDYTLNAQCNLNYLKFELWDQFCSTKISDIEENVFVNSKFNDSFVFSSSEKSFCFKVLHKYTNQDNYTEIYHQVLQLEQNTEEIEETSNIIINSRSDWEKFVSSLSINAKEDLSKIVNIDTNVANNLTNSNVLGVEDSVSIKNFLLNSEGNLIHLAILPYGTSNYPYTETIVAQNNSTNAVSGSFTLSWNIVNPENVEKQEIFISKYNGDFSKIKTVDNNYEDSLSINSAAYSDGKYIFKVRLYTLNGQYIDQISNIYTFQNIVASSSSATSSQNSTAASSNASNGTSAESSNTAETSASTTAVLQPKFSSGVLFDGGKYSLDTLKISGKVDAGDIPLREGEGSLRIYLNNIEITNYCDIDAVSFNCSKDSLQKLFLLGVGNYEFSLKFEDERLNVYEEKISFAIVNNTTSSSFTTSSNVSLSQIIASNWNYIVIVLGICFVILVVPWIVFAIVARKKKRYNKVLAE
jgi:hypothetical protein